MAGKKVKALADKVDALATAQAATNQKVDALADKVDALATAQAATNQQLAETIDALPEKLTERIDAVAAKVDQRFDSLHDTMMRQFQSVIREIHRVEKGGPPPNGSAREYPCPIDGCDHVFRGSRTGWHSHIAAREKHPDWMSRVTDGEKRKQAFRTRFDYWFSDP